MRWLGTKEKQKALAAPTWDAMPSVHPAFTPAMAGQAKDLADRMEGRVVKPGDPDYHAHRLVPSSWDILHFPLLIAYCETFADVRHCLEYARETGVPIAVRASGHSTAGYSGNDGLVIDVSRLVYVQVDRARGQVRVGAGTRSGHLATALDLYGLHVPGGGCHDVRVAGFMQGGGYSYTSRLFGMNCDSAEEVTVMLADGGIVVASERRNPDLFWALRGGTGGNFGVVLEIAYKLRQLGDMQGFRLWWPLDSAPARDVAAGVMDYMQANHMGGERASKLGYQAFVVWQRGPISDDAAAPVLGGWYLFIRGMYDGTQAELDATFAPLKKLAPPAAELYRRGTYRELDSFTHMKPSVPPVDDWAREDKQSAYIARSVGKAGWRQVFERFLQGTGGNTGNIIGIEPYGGAINAVPRERTAFIHRDVDMDLYVDVFWVEQEKKEREVRFLDDFMGFVERSFGNGHSYQNYPRPTQADYRERYWAGSFDTLRAVKHKYDPVDRFKYEQGVLLRPGETDLPISSPQILPGVQPWLAAPIDYEVTP